MRPTGGGVCSFREWDEFHSYNVPVVKPSANATRDGRIAQWPGSA